MCTAGEGWRRLHARASVRSGWSVGFFNVWSGYLVVAASLFSLGAAGTPSCDYGVSFSVLHLVSWRAVCAGGSRSVGDQKNFPRASVRHPCRCGRHLRATLHAGACSVCFVRDVVPVPLSPYARSLLSLPLLQHPVLSSLSTFDERFARYSSRSVFRFCFIPFHHAAPPPAHL